MNNRRTNVRELRRLFRQLVLTYAPVAACASHLGCGGQSDADSVDGDADLSIDAGLPSEGSDRGTLSDGPRDHASANDAGDAGDAGDGSDGWVCTSCSCGLPIPAPPPWRIPYRCAALDGATDSPSGDGDVDASSIDCIDASSPAVYSGSPVNPPKTCLDLGCPIDDPDIAGEGLRACELNVGAGPETLDCLYYPPACGRRPFRFSVTRRGSSRDPLAAQLASSALLEAMSVDAFEILAAELLAHGAPVRLVTAARRAARDEVRHARDMTAIAQRFGGTVAATEVPRPPVRTLEAIATENSVEGCVRETYGALVAEYQARSTSDPGLRAAMKKIAIDEARHAALAWEVAAWANLRLDARARARVDSARSRAVRALRRDLARGPSAAGARVLGLPPARTAVAMVDRLSAVLWRLAA